MNLKHAGLAFILLGLFILHAGLGWIGVGVVLLTCDDKEEGAGQ